MKALQRHKRSIKSVASYFKTEKMFRSGCNGASKTDIAIVVIRALRVYINITVLRRFLLGIYRPNAASGSVAVGGVRIISLVSSCVRM